LDVFGVWAKLCAMRLVSLVIAAALALSATPARATEIRDLAWMKGCWRTDDSATIEMWTAPPVGALMGLSYTWANNQLREWEQLRIDAVGGTIGYVAMPNGHDPVRFNMTEGDGHHIVFANPAHDFPQRIEYVRDGHKLTATVSGGAGQTETYEYREV